MLKEFQSQRYKLAAESLRRKLERRNFQVEICESVAAAKALALAKLNPTYEVAFGGSLTLVEMGLIEALYERQQPIVDREKAQTIEERYERMRQSLLTDVYLTSLNGISEDGQLVNVDSVGNRVAALTFGPKEVWAFVGMNKVYPDLETAITMVRKKTAPDNANRLGLKQTPCVKKGNCGDCLQEECICNTIAVTRRSHDPKRITIFLIADEIGL